MTGNNYSRGTAGRSLALAPWSTRSLWALCALGSCWLAVPEAANANSDMGGGRSSLLSLRPTPTAAPSRKLMLGGHVLARSSLALVLDEVSQAQRVQQVRAAYKQAMRLFNDIELEKALEVVDSAIREAVDAGEGDEPVLAALFTLRAALSYSTYGDEARDDIVEALSRALDRNPHVSIPPELRSEGMENFLETARRESGSGIPRPIVHQPPEAECGDSLLFRALSLVPDDGQVALYWRAAGDTEYQAAEMRVFANVADAWLPVSAHRDADLEYFIVTFDEDEDVEVSIGAMDSPLELSRLCELGPADVELGTSDELGEDVEPEKKRSRARKKSDIGFGFKLGLGTGIGLAHGTADHTPYQMFPSATDVRYGDDDAACAAARWAGRGNGLPSDDVLFGGNTEDVPDDSVFGNHADSSERATAWARAFNRDKCGENNGVVTGLASAPLHLVPEFGIRIKDRFFVSIYARLQLVHGARLQAPNWQGDPTSLPAGGGDEVDVKMAWAIAGHGRILLGKSGAKVRPYVGFFAGYGQTKLMIDMVFSADLDGNSIPDDHESSAADDKCETQVFGYSGGCTEDDRDRAAALREAAKGRDALVDTVTIGPGFFGGSFGLDIDLTPNFGLFAEVQLGGWFPSAASALLDFNLGPVVKF